jgi:predicted phage terminase large subunit-like protein
MRKLELTHRCTGEQLTFDLFQFAREILDYPLLQEDPHHAWCTELDRRHKRSLWLEPRHTFKSTVFTKAYPIWRLLQEPDLRILIVNATAENAEAFLSEIVGQYLRNEVLRWVYHDACGTVPLEPQAAKTKTVLLTTRIKNYSEPSIRAVGALSNLVSAHYDLIIVDDLCNIDDRESPVIREKKKRWFQDLNSVLTPEGELVVVGTHWHFDDVYAYISNELNPGLPDEYKFRIQRDSCYRDDGETPRFPTILSRKRLQALRVEKGEISFSCQYLNQPLPSEHQVFKLDAMHTIPAAEIDLSRAEVIGFCDPSLGGADYAAIVTLLRYNNAWIVYHCELTRMPQSQLIDKVIALHRQFNYNVLGIEANALGKTKSDHTHCSFELVLHERQQEAGVTVPYQLIWHNTNKRARIESIEPHYTNGQLLFLKSWNQDYPLLVEQLLQFPLATHDDGPDALAGAIKLIQRTQKAKRPVLIPRAR